MKALKYSGMRPGTVTYIQDARRAGRMVEEDGTETYHNAENVSDLGPEIAIRLGDVVPIEAYHNQPRTGDVAARHVELGLAVPVDDAVPDAMTAGDAPV